MQELEQNNPWVSDGTYLAFRYFMEYIIPIYLEEGINKNNKTILIPVSNKEDGVYIKDIYLGKISYPEFITYIYYLESYCGIRLNYIKNIHMDYRLPFNLEKLKEEYYDELQREDYPIYNNSTNKLNELAIEEFKNKTLKEIIVKAFSGKYNLSEIYDTDGVTCITRILYLSLEIRNDELYINEYNIGKVNINNFLSYLTSIPGYMGTTNNYYPDGDYILAYNLEELINYYYQENMKR